MNIKIRSPGDNGWLASNLLPLQSSLSRKKRGQEVGKKDKQEYEEGKTKAALLLSTHCWPGIILHIQSICVLVHLIFTNGLRKLYFSHFTDQEI